MNGRPGGSRRKNVTGNDSGGGRRGSGLGSGPVGRRRGYSGRPTGPSQDGGSQNAGGGRVGSDSGMTRGLGGGKLILIVLAALFIFGGGEQEVGHGGEPRTKGGSVR